MNVKKLGLKEIRVHFGAFDYALFCIVGPRESVTKYVAWKHDDPEFHYPVGTTRGLYFERTGYVPIIWIPRKPRTPEEHSTLAHEVLHAVRIMLVDWAGIPLTRDTDEAFCHALGHGVRQILTALK